MFGNHVDSYATLVDPIVIVIATRMDKQEGAFILPMVNAFDEDVEDKLKPLWNMFGFCPRRGPYDAEQGTCTEMPKAPGSQYTWEAIVTLKLDDTTTAADMGRNIANHFTEFAKTASLYRKPMPFVFRKAHTADPKPVNHYLMDEDVVLLLRRLYSEASKADILADGDVVAGFFGTIFEAKKVLDAVNDEQWLTM